MVASWIMVWLLHIVNVFDKTIWPRNLVYGGVNVEANAKI